MEKTIMEDSYQEIKNIHLQSARHDSAIIIGNGKSAENIPDVDIAVIINGGTKKVDCKNVINIIKSIRSINTLNKNYINIVPFDIYDDLKNKLSTEKLKSYNLISLSQEYLALNDESNLLQHAAILSIKILKDIGIKKIYYTGYSFTVYKNDSVNSTEYNSTYFQKQHDEFNNYIQNSSIPIIHYDKKCNNKKISIKNLIETKLKNNDVIIVAEITNNHFGDFNKLCTMALLAKEQGADIIKIQKRDVDTFYTQEELNKKYDSTYGTTLADFRKKVELSIDEIKKFDIFCHENNILWFSSILDKNSFWQFNDTFSSLDLIKLPSTISKFNNYLTDVSKNYHGDIVISTGATDQDYIDWIIKHFYNKDRKLFLLHTLSCYPTPEENLNIGTINYYYSLKKDYPNIIPGYSGHDIGYIGGMMAVAAGAMMVEKHIKYNSENLHFDNVAIDLSNGDFKEYCDNIKKAKVMRGSFDKKISSIEHHKYSPNAKSN